MTPSTDPATREAPPRVLAVIGSPRRRGNTFHAVQAVEEHIKALCGGSFEYLFLADADLGLCRGCGACLTVGEERCPLHDDRVELDRRLSAADGVVFACPVYIDNMPALMKNFLDRFAYANHRPRFFDQKTLLVSVSAGSSPNATLDRLAAVRYSGFTVVHRLGIAVPAWMQMTDALRVNDARVRKASQAFCEALAGGRVPGPSLDDILSFRAKQALFSVLPDIYKADHRYWGERGWLDPKCRYYVEAPISPVKEAIARLMLSRMRRAFLAQAGPGADVPPVEK